jgi:hypothetical protein
MQKKMLCGIAAAGLSMALLGFSAPAVAGVTFFSPITAFEDDDLDWIFDANGNLKTSGTLDVNDRLVSVVELNRTFGVPSGGPANIGPGDELTGVADITVLSKVAVGGGQFAYTFGASGASGLLSGQPAGAMVALYLDPLAGATIDLDVINGNCGNLGNGADGQCLDAASDGALWAVAGIDPAGDGDAQWFAQAFDAIAAILASAASSKVGAFNFALDILINNTGVGLAPQTCGPLGFFGTPLNPCTGAGDNFIDVIGSGDFLGGQGLAANGSDAIARSDADFQVAPVPEPGTLALLSTILVAIGLIARRGTRS